MDKAGSFFPNKTFSYSGSLSYKTNLFAGAQGRSTEL